MPVNSVNLEKISDSINLFNPLAELLIVSKKQSIEDIECLLKRGYKNFAENRVQEAISKFRNLKKEYQFTLQLIGPLQTNKALEALKTFDIIQSLDRIKLVDVIAKNIETSKEIKTKEFYIQINIGNEEQKSGIAVKLASQFYNYCLSKSLKISGLMCIPPNHENPEFYFKSMVEIKNSINPNLKLSMGMSNDYITALKYGSNLIRIGSLVFS